MSCLGEFRADLDASREIAGGEPKRFARFAILTCEDSIGKLLFRRPNSGRIVFFWRFFHRQRKFRRVRKSLGSRKRRQRLCKEIRGREQRQGEKGVFVCPLALFAMPYLPICMALKRQAEFGCVEMRAAS